MKCNFFETLAENRKDEYHKCLVGPAKFEPSEEDVTKYCKTTNFRTCPRHTTDLEIKTSSKKG